MSKLNTLAQIEGLPTQDMLKSAMCDSVCPGICKTPGCDYTAPVEPDQRQGYCGACGRNTIVSCLVLAGLM
jgi:hypothetical protein